jgi:protein SCO1/2
MARTAPAVSPGKPPPAGGSPRFVIAAAVLAGLVILGAGAFLALEMRDNPRGAGGTVLASAIGGPFQLTDQNGKTVTDADLKGKWSLIYFGYTHCPDACPTALNDISIALEELGEKRDEVRPVFITVDPERDTSEALKLYVTSFDAPILALTGTTEQVAQAAKSYRVYYAKHPEAGGDYSMDHSSVIYVMDPQGRFTASFTHESSPEQIAERLKKLLA